MITKKEKNFYSDKMIQLGITQGQIYDLTKKKWGLKAEISRSLNISSSSLSCILIGHTFNPKILVEVYEYLNKKHTNRYFKHLQDLTRAQKSVGSLLMNGFSYWEAIRIAND